VLMQVKGRNLDAQTRADVAAEFQAAVVEVLIAKSLAALKRSGLKQLVVAGGVGANRELRTRLTQAASDRGFQVFYPALEFCTDNGAMIAFAATLRLQRSALSAQRSANNFSVRPRWDLSALGPVNA
jgi:N6-L-threonylcarbamoyladenine synthase